MAKSLKQAYDYWQNRPDLNCISYPALSRSRSFSFLLSHRWERRKESKGREKGGGQKIDDDLDTDYIYNNNNNNNNKARLFLRVCVCMFSFVCVRCHVGDLLFG